MNEETNLYLKVIEEAKIPHGQAWNRRSIDENQAILTFAKYGVWIQDNAFQWNIRELITAPQKDLLYMLNWDKEVRE